MALFLVAGDDDGWSVVGDAIIRSWWSVMDFGFRSSVTRCGNAAVRRLWVGATVAVLRRRRRGCVAASEALLQQAGDGEDKATSGSAAVALRLDGWRWRWLCNSVASVVRKTKKQARKTKTIAEQMITQKFLQNSQFSSRMGTFVLAVYQPSRIEALSR
nr:hypothetical protein Iba_chr01aCG3960 [Ipomoea batatas]